MPLVFKIMCDNCHKPFFIAYSEYTEINDIRKKYVQHRNTDECGAYLTSLLRKSLYDPVGDPFIGF
jgi:hypothetical protein